MDTFTDTVGHSKPQRLNHQPTGIRSSLQSPLTFRPEDTQFENIADRVNPRYMTPTASSRAQVSTPEPRASTPPVSSSAGKRKAWMVSAARRVGIVPSTPRSKKEGRIYKRISPRKKAANESGEEVCFLILREQPGCSHVSSIIGAPCGLLQTLQQQM
jgi:hypothetical protein